MEKVPVYVKIDEYQDVLDIIHTVQSKLDEAKRTLEKINGLKSEEDTLIDQWQKSLTEVGKKVDFIDRTLNEPEQY
jgi:hypothetical protein